MKKRIMSLILVASMCIGMFSTISCSIKMKDSDDFGIASKSLTKYDAGTKISVDELKEKHDEEKIANNQMKPMYSIDSTQEFTFTFPYKFGTIDIQDAVSIHSDVKCEDDSKLTADYELEIIDESKTKVTIKPSSAIINTKDAEGKKRDEESTKPAERQWGNLGIYYLKISYDYTAKSPKKFEEPLITPFTVKSKIDAVNVKGSTNSNGVYVLSWDKVEKATKYNIYQLGQPIVGNEKGGGVHGAKHGYGVYYFLYYIDTITDTQYNTFADSYGGVNRGIHNRKDGLTLDSNGTTCYIQNENVKGEYYVTAVDENGNESNFSQGVDSIDFKDNLPNMMSENLDGKEFDSFEELPKSVEVSMIDYSKKLYPVTYSLHETQNASTGNMIAYRYTIPGTGFFGVVRVKPKNDSNNVPDTVNKDSNAVQSVTADDSGTRVRNIPSSAEGDGGSKGNIDKQREKTKSDIEEGNKSMITLDNGTYVNADSSEEEWLALNLINGEERISIKGYPELLSAEKFNDIFKKVYYQNPYITKLADFKMDYKNSELIVKYEHSKDEIKKMQQEIVKEAKKVINDNIKSSMSDEEKITAIYDYLNDNAEYSTEVLEEAKKNDYVLPSGKFTECFETYGILCKKRGVCQSYGYVTKLLCDLAGVECVQVTGVTPTCGHAWNKVKLGNSWYNVDCTNNEKNCGIKKMFFLCTDTTMKAIGSMEDEEYCLNTERKNYVAASDDKEYYRVNNLYARSTDEYCSLLNNHFDDGKQVALRYDSISKIDEKEFAEGISNVVSKHNYSGEWGMSRSLGEYYVFIRKN